MQISREWATPLTIGAFSLMSVTGLLMFFHWDMGLNKLAHEWVGLVMIGGVAAHAAANWPAFKRYFLAGNLGRGIIAFSLAVLVGSFFSWTGQKRLPPPVMAMRAIVNAPLAKIAPLSGRSTEQAIAALAKAGVHVASGEMSLEQATNATETCRRRRLLLYSAKAIERPSPGFRLNGFLRRYGNAHGCEGVSYAETKYNRHGGRSVQRLSDPRQKGVAAYGGDVVGRLAAFLHLLSSVPQNCGFTADPFHLHEIREPFLRLAEAVRRSTQGPHPESPAALALRQDGDRPGHVTHALAAGAFCGAAGWAMRLPSSKQARS
ncbi:MAG: DUF4405 domain-containing protein [Hyphomicrobiales bacterium]|nr:MAG: DUF4405 domain-containing protein [Hyphomicrobiales bacterium]